MACRGQIARGLESDRAKRWGGRVFDVREHLGGLIDCDDHVPGGTERVGDAARPGTQVEHMASGLDERSNGGQLRIGWQRSVRVEGTIIRSDHCEDSLTPT